MSLSREAYLERKWEGLREIRKALEDLRPDDRYYGYSTASYNMFDRLTDVLEIALVAIDNKGAFDQLDRDLCHREISILMSMLTNHAELFEKLASEVRTLHDHIEKIDR